MSVNFAPKETYKPGRPWILDEKVPRPRSPQEIRDVHCERMRQQALEIAKNKPDSERNVSDYLVLAEDKLKVLLDAPVCYLA
ncbi:hypothetical protein IJZ97_05035 [bacterium]|nr:hypothetical protein [bacterium]